MKVGKRTIGPGQPIYLVVDGGSNHCNDLDKALKLIDVAAECGADAIKFQFFRADDMVPKDHHDWATFKKFELPDAWLPVMRKRAYEDAIDLFYSVFSPEDVVALEALDNPPCYKIASAELTYTDLLEAVARTGKPVILSTGMATDAEADYAANTLTRAGLDYKQILSLHCVSAYPAPPQDMNLRTIVEDDWCIRYDGLSDHSADPYAAPLLAAALGACVIEKHFCLSRQDDSPDAPFSIEPDELKALATSLHQAHLMLQGDGVKGVMQSEQASLSDRRVLIDGRWLRGQGA